MTDDYQLWGKQLFQNTWIDDDNCFHNLIEGLLKSNPREQIVIPREQINISILERPYLPYIFRCSWMTGVRGIRRLQSRGNTPERYHYISLESYRKSLISQLKGKLSAINNHLYENNHLLTMDTFKDFILECQDTNNGIWDDSQDRKVSTALKHIYRRTFFPERDDLIMATDVAHAASAAAKMALKKANDSVIFAREIADQFDENMDIFDEE